MPLRVSKPLDQVIVILILSVVLALSGCAPPLPATWQNDIPGVYAGDQSGFREVIEFKADATFRHQVFRDNKSIHLESGKWRVLPRKHQLILEPFTEFYHPMGRKFSADGEGVALYYFYPIPDGKSFNMISASANYEFRLARAVSGPVKNHP